MKRWQIVVLVIIVVMGLSGLSVARFLMPYELDDEIKAAHAQGLPTSMAECFPKLPPGQDAAPDYDRASELITGFWTKDFDTAVVSLRAPGGPTHAQMAKLRTAFDHDNGYIAAIHAAAKKPGCSWTTADLAYRFRGTRVDDCNHATRALQYEAMLQMWEGKPVDAARTLRLDMNVAKHADAIPSIVMAMIAFANEAAVDTGYQRLLLNAGSNPEVDRLVREALRTDLGPTDMSVPLAGELAAVCVQGPPAPKNGRIPFYTRILYKGQAAAAVHWMTRGALAARVSPDRQRAAIQGVLDEFGRASRRNPVLRQVATALPFAVHILDYLDLGAARRRVNYTAACVLEYRARTGRYPATLSQAVQPVPIDPFSGDPLSYKRTTTGFELAATAAAARWAAKTRPGRHNDIIFTYPAAIP